MSWRTECFRQPFQKSWKKCEKHVLKGILELIRLCKLIGLRFGRVMKPRQVSPVFRAVFLSDNSGRDYWDTEKLRTILDSLTKLGQILEFRSCKGVRTLKKQQAFSWSKSKTILYLFVETYTKLQIASVSYQNKLT